MNREDIRENTMQLIYQMDANNEFDYEKIAPIEENSKVLSKKQAVAVLSAIREHIDEIDAIIKANLEKWTFDRVSKTDLAILRNAVAEILYVDNLPPAVSIDEAVRIAKKYGDDKSFAFINSVLSKIARYLANRAEA